MQKSWILSIYAHSSAPDFLPAHSRRIIERKEKDEIEGRVSYTRPLFQKFSLALSVTQGIRQLCSPVVGSNVQSKAPGGDVSNG
jgi:hypothetical protein